MALMTVAQASEALGITKEAIYNRIRRKTLDSITKDGIKYVDIKQSNKTENIISNSLANDDRYIEFLENELTELKAKNEKLELDKERLIGEKESLLLQLKDEVERVYKERDKQLLTMVSIFKKSLVPAVSQNTINARFEELSPYEKEMIGKSDDDKWLDLKAYLIARGVENKRQERILNAANLLLGRSLYLKEENGSIFFNSQKKLKSILIKDEE